MPRTDGSPTQNTGTFRALSTPIISSTRRA